MAILASMKLAMNFSQPFSNTSGSSAKRHAARRTTLWTVLAAASLASPALMAAPGDLSTGFGGGIITFSVGPYHYLDLANAAAVQADGSVVVGGITRTTSASFQQNSDWSLARRKEGGGLDTSFGGGTGHVLEGVGTNYRGGTHKPWSWLSGMVVKSDGSIIGAGVGLDVTRSYLDPFVLRWHADGTLDNSFGSGGIASASYGKAVNTSVIALARDHKLLVGGSYESGSQKYPVLMRFTSDGALDPTFGTNGKLVVPASIPVAQQGGVSSITIQPNNKIVVTMLNQYVSHAAFMRLNDDGTIDSTFGTGGIKNLPMSVQQFGDVTVQHDGKIVAYWGVGGTVRKAGVVRVNADGTFDMAFNGQGWVDISGGSKLYAYAMALLPTGQMLLAGHDGNVLSNLVVARVTAAGVLDTSFTSTDGQSGIVETPNPDGYVELHSLVLEDSGRFVASGRSGGPSTFSQMLVARFKGDPLHLQPTGFAFTNLTGVPVSTVQVSDVVKVKGLTSGAHVPVTVDNGKYSINGHPFTARLGYAKNGDLIMVDHTSAATSGAAVTTRLTIGGINAPIDPWHARGAVVARFTSTTQ